MGKKRCPDDIVDLRLDNGVNENKDLDVAGHAAGNVIGTTHTKMTGTVISSRCPMQTP